MKSRAENNIKPKLKYQRIIPILHNEYNIMYTDIKLSNCFKIKKKSDAFEGKVMYTLRVNT